MSTLEGRRDGPASESIAIALLHPRRYGRVKRSHPLSRFRADEASVPRHHRYGQAGRGVERVPPGHRV